MEDKTFPATDWPGCLYYDMILQEIADTTYYFLLGADFNDLLTNKKLIDVLYFRPDEQPVFGAPLFYRENKVHHRILFEYAEQAVMTLRYDPPTGMIIFDHLSPSRPQYTGNSQFYGPDFSYDGFAFDGSRWVFKADLDLRNR
jgi:hypothetical protein